MNFKWKYDVSNTNDTHFVVFVHRKKFIVGIVEI